MIDAEAFREAGGQFATGVTVVTFPPADDPHGITVNAFATASLDPPLVAVALDRGTESHSLLVDEGVGAFCVNVLSAGQRALGEHFAGMSETDDPFAATRAAATGAPVFEDALAYFDCEADARFDAGDHSLFLGDVAACEVLDAESDPLTFFRGEWGGDPT